jgi:TRAP-type C4-dicarboxylate transport system substrate-binding protein
MIWYPCCQLPKVRDPDGARQPNEDMYWVAREKMQFDQLKEREFITLLGGVAAALPTARAQSSAHRATITRRSFKLAQVVVVLAASQLLTVTSTSAQVKWNLPSAYPADNFHSQNLEAFAKDVAQVTDGKLVIRVYPNASLFPASAIKSAVRIGQAQIGETLISLHDNEDPIFGIDVVPFLATSYNEARKLWAASKPLIVAGQGLIVLFAVPWPPQGIFAKKEINEIADMKGLSWRVYNASTQRIAQIVEAYPVTIQAADLRRALATELISALMTSAATGYDVKVWDMMSYFYDTQAWLPKNVILVNRAAFDQLDKRTQESLFKVAAAAEARGWWWSQDRTKWYTEQLAAHGMKVTAPSSALKAGLRQIGERLTGEWLMRASVDGLATIDAYRKLIH